MGEGFSGSRRALLGAAVVGGLLVSSLAQAKAVAPAELERLADQVRALSRASGRVDYDDPDAETAYYAAADRIMEAVIALPATSWPALRVKAEALAWCHGGTVDYGPRPSTAERITASIAAGVMGQGAAAKENNAGTSA